MKFGPSGQRAGFPGDTLSMAQGAQHAGALEPSSQKGHSAQEKEKKKRRERKKKRKKAPFFFSNSPDKWQGQAGLKAARMRDGHQCQQETWFGSLLPCPSNPAAPLPSQLFCLPL